MILKPCHVCNDHIRKDCPERMAMRHKLKGVGVTSATLNCKRLRAIYGLGIRIESIFVVEHNGYGEPFSESFPGTVIGFKGNKVRVWFDESPSGGNTKGDRPNSRSIIARYPKYLRLLDEPPKKVCPECGRPEDRENINFSCEKCDSGISNDIGELPW
jgi:hypothetical protein